MQIDVVFDTVCPWCFIGKRRLERALAQRPDLPIQLNWRPFLLNPEMPTEGIDRTAYLIKKFGSETRVRRIYGAIGDAGHSVEIEFAFDRIHRTPNSVDSHRMVRFAKDQGGRADITVEALFHAFFLDGRDIGQRGVLLEIAEDIGLDAAALAAHFDDGEDIPDIHEANARAHRLGINGVPAFSFPGNLVISGAQEPPVLVRMIDAAGVMAETTAETAT